MSAEFSSVSISFLCDYLAITESISEKFSLYLTIRPQFADTLFIVRLRPDMSMHHAVIVNYYFLVQKIERENRILSSTQILL